MSIGVYLLLEGVTTIFYSKGHYHGLTYHLITLLSARARHKMHEVVNYKCNMFYIDFTVEIASLANV